MTSMSSEWGRIKEILECGGLEFEFHRDSDGDSRCMALTFKSEWMAGAAVMILIENRLSKAISRREGNEIYLSVFRSTIDEEKILRMREVILETIDLIESIRENLGGEISVHDKRLPGFEKWLQDLNDKARSAVYKKIRVTRDLSFRDLGLEPRRDELPSSIAVPSGSIGWVVSCDGPMDDVVFLNAAADWSRNLYIPKDSYEEVEDA